LFFWQRYFVDRRNPLKGTDLRQMNGRLTFFAADARGLFFLAGRHARLKPAIASANKNAQ
jgi:hypothetical protein